MINFPWRKYNKSELLEEYFKLKKKIKNIDKLKKQIFSTVGFKCTNSFFQYERMNTPGYGRPSTIDYWKKNKDAVILFSDKHNRDLFSTLNYFNHAPSQFPIMTAIKIYKYFNATKVLDPFAGWGDRCLAAMALDIDYTGIDSNTHLKPLYSEMINFYPSKSKVKMIYKKAEKVDIDKLDFDFVFTSPPFWRSNKLLELYHKTELYYDIFFKKFIVLLKKILTKKVWVCLYIPLNMYKDIISIIGNCQIIISFKSNNIRIENIYCWKY
jgi:16S rRNA G966 N2-methylase RsmD